MSTCRSKVRVSATMFGIIAAACSGGQRETRDNAGADDDGDTAPTDAPTGSPGRVPIFRLNRYEYNNTVRDLLGSSLRPADDFRFADPVSSSFDNDAFGLVEMTDQHFEDFQAAAGVLVAEALQPDSEARKRYFTCDVSTEGRDCAVATLAAFAPKAFRRPLQPEEAERLTTAFDAGVEQGLSAEEALGLAMEAVLLSPHFLYRIELDPDPDDNGDRPLNGFETASRLSYLLWSSMPDDELFAAAEDGRLDDAAGVRNEMIRMLQDPKARALVDSFGEQLLDIRRLDDRVPEATIFPTWNEGLRHAMKEESRHLFGEIAAGELGFDAILRADHAHLTPALAEHYGLPAPKGDAVTRMALPADSHRGGFLTNASILTVTSTATRTSPVIRGRWVLEALLCQKQPNPPPDVSPLVEADADGPPKTLRERLEQHRRERACAICHDLIDPVGFGLEAYDGIGRYRDTDHGRALDTSGKLPDGRTFDGIDELKKTLSEDPEFSRCMTTKFYSYALRREIDEHPGSADPAVVDHLHDRFVSDGLSMRALLAALVQSQTFLMRGGAPQ